MTKEVKIMIGVAAVILIGGIALFIKQPKPPEEGAPVDNQSLVRSTSHMTGKADAKVSVVEFGDYECPACAVAEPAIERLRIEYKDNPNVNFVFRNFPLPQHTKALTAAEAAEAAGEQGKFWEMHDKLYQNQNAWVGPGNEQSLFMQYAQDLGLDTGKFKQSWDQNRFAQVIRTDQQDGESLGVNGTPTFFINGQKTQGYQYEELKAKIEEKLK